MKTVGITIELTKSLWNTRKAVIMESGFFVPKGIFEINTRGVYGNALIKKSLYWSMEVHGYGISDYFSLNKIGGVG